jgi:thymidine kinase
MAKLYFRYGTVGSAKTLNLLAVAHNYRQQGKAVLLVKPEIDTRFGKDIIKTRAGLEMPADCLVPRLGPFILPDLTGVVCVLVDEAQFLTPQAIDELHRCVYVAPKIPVICYGLRTDFRRQLFPASQRLMELADSIEEIKTICTFCLRKAVFNLKLCDGTPTLDGPAVELGCEEKYLPVCAACYAVQHGIDPSRSLG